MCLSKILHPNGSDTMECPCPRYIPQDNPTSGPRVCRDCEHWESLHPANDVEKPTSIANLMARLKPKIEEVRGSAQVSDDEARRESNAGFKKISEEHKGRGGATKYQKKTASRGSSSKASSDEKPQIVGNMVMIPDAHFPNPNASDSESADDVKAMGLAPVPSVTKIQQLRDSGLVISETGDGDEIQYRESWSVLRIDRLLSVIFRPIWIYMTNTHELEEGEFWWILLSAERSTLLEFIKKGAITGSDLTTVMSGKGKRTDQKTLYFALRNNVPYKLWRQARWLEAPSDADFTETSKESSKGKGKGKGKLQAKSSPARRSARKVTVKEEEHVVIDVDLEENGTPSPHKTDPKGKGKAKLQRSPPAKIKLEPELAAIAKTDTLFLGFDTDSDIEFPDSLIAGPAPAPTTATPAAQMPAAPQLALLPAVMSAAPSPAAPSAFSLSTPSTTPAFGHPINLGASASTPSSSALSATPGPSASSSSSHPFPFQRDYAAETTAMDAFNEHGNYREGVPKRTFDTAFLESSSLTSPKRPSYNPWNRPRKSL